MKIGKVTIDDYLKAIHIGNRNAEISNGWKAKHKIHKSKKSYKRIKKIIIENA